MDKNKLQATILILFGTLLVLYTVYTIADQIASRQEPTPPPSSTASYTSMAEIPQPTDHRLGLIAQLVRQHLRGDETNVDVVPLGVLEERTDGIYVALRSMGIEKASAWTQQGKTGEMISAGLELALDNLDDAAGSQIDAVELCVTDDHREIPSTAMPTNSDRGVIGIRMIYKDKAVSFSPTEMIAKNLSFENAVERAAVSLNVTVEGLLANGTFQVFDCEQFLVFVEGDLPAIQLFRGNQIVPIDAVTLDNVTEFAKLASDWLVRQVQEDGRMLYLYFPSRGEESTGNNMIRQWMATLALDRIAAFNGNDAALVQLTKKNILYNLEHFYVVENGLGLIDFQGEVKLGAMALAALALHEHPHSAEFSAQIDALTAGVESLWKKDGSFETFYRPEGRSGQNQNFYPGETLLFWSTLYTENRDPDLLSRFMQSFTYYREWHRQNINPAFIPWHTQAYYNLWKLTGNEELKSFVFEMNDWLLDFQEIEASPYDDLPGRFYDSSRPQYGPPHASSDGVYLEGLVDAYLLAKETGDSQRQDAYALAIRYGIRSLMQLQFADEIDMYYISKTDKVLGGLRTTEYDNSIRVDNVQHGLMAILKILVNPEAHDIFDN
jgi:hypothetical protein